MRGGVLVNRPEPACEVATFTEQSPAIAAPRAGVTDRAGRWMTRQVGQGQPVSAVAAELGCDWHTVMDAALAYGTPLIEHPDRIGSVTALGLDETLFVRTGAFKARSWVTSIVDVTSPAQLLDVVEGRTAKAPPTWIDARTQAWRADIAWAALDLSGPYRKTFNDSLPDAVQVADPFHVIKLANARLDDVRRRVQQETLGHRGHRDDPLYDRGGCSPRAMNASTRPARRSCSASSKPATPTARCGWPGTPRRPCAASARSHRHRRGRSAPWPRRRGGRRVRARPARSRAVQRWPGRGAPRDPSAVLAPRIAPVAASRPGPRCSPRPWPTAGDVRRCACRSAPRPACRPWW